MIVCCNGHRDAKDKWLSVYVSALKGQYDTYLHWPLNCTVHFRIRTADSKYLRTVDVISHTRVLDDCGIVRASCSTSESQYTFKLALNDIKCLQGGCLLMEVDSVAFK